MIPSLPNFDRADRPLTPRPQGETPLVPVVKRHLGWRLILRVSTIVAVSLSFVIGYSGGYVQNVGFPICPSASPTPPLSATVAPTAEATS